MGEIRIVVPGKTRGYPYPVCKNTIAKLLIFYLSLNDSLLSLSQNLWAENQAIFYILIQIHDSND